LAEEAVQLALDQELKVTQQINNLVDLAIKENDHLTREFLQWFVAEQLEEVASMTDLLNVVKRAGEDNLLRVEDYLARNPRADAEMAE
jgi:ferritin